MSPPVYVNGRFLQRSMTGVERFGKSVLLAVDDMLGDLPSSSEWIILMPPGGDADYGFRNMKVSPCGRFSGHLWEQVDLVAASRKGLLINLCNSAPILHPHQLTVIHDALVYRFPEGFSRSYGLLHRTLGRLLAKRSRLATVSSFSQSELSAILKVPAEKIAVIPNALDHFDHVQPDEGVLDTFDLRRRRYLLFVGSPAPNKNLTRAIEAFRQADAQDACFVVVGSAAKSFSQGLGVDLPETLIRTGRLFDEQVKALYMHAAALVFPSTYEGFGIPPLEAMSLDCPVIASDIPVVREVCADAARYFDPLDISAMTGAINDVLQNRIDSGALISAGRRRTQAFSWRRSAGELLRIVGEMERAPL